MNLQTTVDISPSEWQIRYTDRVLLLGSCFSDNIARKMGEYYFRVSGNPYGALYNPISIAHHMTDEVIASHDVFIITFGSAWVYLDRALMSSAVAADSLAAVVDNCQRRPAADFVRYRLTVEDIVSAWRPILERMSGKRLIFTVSPIRHRKDGLHENQISKGILLQAVDALIANSGLAADIQYFPSYEIVLDELRDYRYYAEDMLHPSPVAVEYIWERFSDTYIYDAPTRASMRELHQYWLDTQHRPLHPDSPEAQLFQQHLAESLSHLRTRYPWI